MRFNLLPPELLGLLLASGSLFPRCSVAGPAVNVALQASFNAPPYILELLLVMFLSSLFEDKTQLIDG